MTYHFRCCHHYQHTANMSDRTNTSPSHSCMKPANNTTTTTTTVKHINMASNTNPRNHRLEGDHTGARNQHGYQSKSKLPDRVTLIVDQTRFVSDPKLFTAHPNTMLGRWEILLCMCGLRLWGQNKQKIKTRSKCNLVMNNGPFLIFPSQNNYQVLEKFKCRMQRKHPFW